jgi:hypothetical protein
MSITVATNIANLNTYISDDTNDRISATERLEALTEATVWLNEELGNDHAIKTYDLDFLDTVNYYKVTSSITDLLESAELRRKGSDTGLPKSSKELAAEIAEGSTDFSWAIERRNADTFIAVTLNPKSGATQVASFESLTGDGGTWVADTSTSDANNLSIDNYEFIEGSASLKFDATVAQSGNNLASILNTSLAVKNLAEHQDIGSWLVEVYLPSVTNITSFTLVWGSSASAYWSATVTTDIDGGALRTGWNTLKLNWSSATKTASPDVTQINYIKASINYTGSQTNTVGFRIDDLRIANPERLTFFYNSWDVGTNSSGASISQFGATSDIPFYSGKYDQYRWAVAHKAASILYYGPLRDPQQGSVHEKDAEQQVRRLSKIVPKSTVKESHNFKVYGLNFNKRKYRRTR